MNNILPTDIPIHEKYDLKGSLYHRKASKEELAKKSPTYKDIDFLNNHKEGILIQEDYYDNILNSLRRDCSILESFGIMDYSMLLGIHNLEKERVNKAIETYYQNRVNNADNFNNESDFDRDRMKFTYRNSTSVNKIFNL
jgi:1-phosphatidylinositol-4-phosphate 5-kinase